MRRTLKNHGFTTVLILGSMAAGLFLRNSWGADASDELITLDPLCELPEARNPPLPLGNPAPSTRRMAELLAKFGENPGPSALDYMSDRKATLLAGKLANTTDPGEKLKLLLQIGIQDTQAGRPDRALNTFADLERFVAHSGAQLGPRDTADLRMCQAMAYLRLGEQENCQSTHNPVACIFPLEPKAYHLLPRGSRSAIARFNERLAQFPNDLSARWLLNLAHMTIGQYPDKVPQQFLIPPQAFASEYQMPRFRNVSAELGLDVNDLAGGVIIDDFDNDGLYDIVISAWDLQGQLRYYHNNGNGTFTERTSEAGLVGEVGALNIQQTDYNNDGLLDIWMLRGGWLGKAGRMPKSLLEE